MIGTFEINLLFSLPIRFSVEVHVVWYNAKYGSYDNATMYPNGIAVVALFGQVISFFSLQVIDNPHLLRYEQIFSKYS